MEMNAASSPANDKQPSDCSTSVNGENKPAQKEVSSSVFVNHAAISWHESRKKWTGDQSRRPQRMSTDGVISWSTTYEELLSTNEPFSEQIPLALMEMNAASSPANDKQPSDCSTSVNGENKPAQKEVSSSVFVNHAAISWHESRKKWTGDQSRRPQRMSTDGIISWSTTYEELLSTNEPFSERIPLAEMVDFLVDIWQDEGLFD